LFWSNKPIFKWGIETGGPVIRFVFDLAVALWAVMCDVDDKRTVGILRVDVHAQDISTQQQQTMFQLVIPGPPNTRPTFVRAMLTSMGNQMVRRCSVVLAIDQFSISPSP